MTVTLSFVLDGESVSINVHPMERLLDVLRDRLGKTGVKEGCGEGECGACAVFVDGKLVNSCCVAAGAVQDAQVETVHGVRDTDSYRTLEQAFQEAGAVQCGFCTPGMVMAGISLLRENPHPTEPIIREALSGNLCRCTGYNMIVDGILLAADKREGPW